MKIQTAFLLLILGCLFVCPTGVRGDLTTGTILVDWGAGTLAGEFLIQATGFAGQGTSTADPGWFETFCLEYNEDLPEMGDVYDVVLNTVAVSGGLDSSSGSVEGGNPLYPIGENYGDPIDPKTAWLYQSFLDGTLVGYDYGFWDRWFSANALQRVIWGIEGEYGPDWTPTYELDSQFYAAAVAAAPTDIGDVRVMNLYQPGKLGVAGYGGQDLLVSVVNANNPVTVPAPGAAVLGILGLLLTAGIKKRLDGSTKPV